LVRRHDMAAAHLDAPRYDEAVPLSKRIHQDTARLRHSLRTLGNVANALTLAGRTAKAVTRNKQVVQARQAPRELHRRRGDGRQPFRAVPVTGGCNWSPRTLSVARGQRALGYTSVSLPVTQAEEGGTDGSGSSAQLGGHDSDVLPAGGRHDLVSQGLSYRIE
jgi:hypothetical protein